MLLATKTGPKMAPLPHHLSTTQSISKTNTTLCSKEDINTARLCCSLQKSSGWQKKPSRDSWAGTALSLLWLRRLFLYGHQMWKESFLLALAFYPLPVFTFLQPSRPQRNAELRNLTSSDIPAGKRISLRNQSPSNPILQLQI